MCKTLGELRQAMSRYASGFDAAVLSVDDARRAVNEAAAIEATAATIKALASARVAKVGDARRRGARSAAHDLARATGTSVSSAREAVETGERMGHQPALRAAAAAGELSATQASLVSEGAEADPGAEQRLVGVAKGGSLGELRQAVSEVKAAAEPDPGVAHLGRRPTAYQRSALQWMYPSCAAPGCADQIHLENDHREDWAKTHFTAFDLMDRLCRFHHRLKTNEGWGLVDGTGKRDFVPPDDLRHPRHKRRAA